HRVLDRDHAEFGLARCDRCETVLEGRAGHRLGVRIGLADGEVRVRTRLALKYDSAGHGRSATPQSIASMGSFLITAAAASYSRFKSQNHTEIINLLVSGGRLGRRSQLASSLFCAISSRARARSSGVSTPSGTLSTSSTSMRMPA